MWIFVGGSLAVLHRHLEILERFDDFCFAVLGAQIDLPADLGYYSLNLTVAGLDLQIPRLIILYRLVVKLEGEG